MLSLGVFSFSVLVVDLPGSHDPDVLPRFPHAEIVDFRQAPGKGCIYPLGTISHISGHLCMEGEVCIEGKLTALAYHLPPEHSSQGVFTAARTALFRTDATPLLQYERHGRGSGSLLVDTVFGNVKLYDLGEQQACLLVRLAISRESSLMTVYLIIRGNRRAYLQAEKLKANVPLTELLSNPATLLRPLKANDELILSHVPAESIDPWLGLLIRTLRLDIGVRVELPGKHVQEWRDTLRGQDVLNNRMELGQLEVESLHLNWLH